MQERGIETDVLQSRKHSEFILTADFAEMVNRIINQLPPKTTITDLRYAHDVGNWRKFRNSLTKNQKATLTKALLGPSAKRKDNGEYWTIADTRKKTFDDLNNTWKVHAPTAAFLVLAFKAPEEE